MIHDILKQMLSLYCLFNQNCVDRPSCVCCKHTELCSLYVIEPSAIWLTRVPSFCHCQALVHDLYWLLLTSSWDMQQWTFSARQWECCTVAIPVLSKSLTISFSHHSLNSLTGVYMTQLDAWPINSCGCGYGLRYYHAVDAAGRAGLLTRDSGLLCSIWSMKSQSFVR